MPTNSLLKMSGPECYEHALECVAEARTARESDDYDLADFSLGEAFVYATLANAAAAATGPHGGITDGPKGDWARVQGLSYP